MIINQKEVRHNLLFHEPVCALSEAKGMITFMKKVRASSKKVCYNIVDLGRYRYERTEDFDEKKIAYFTGALSGPGGRG